MRPADKEGPYGKAWTCALPPLGQRDKPDADGCLAYWLVLAPKSHIYWPYKLISALHLRDIPGAKPAFKVYPEAQYELNILSINPELCPNPDPDDLLKGYPTLRPADVVVQFHDVKDEQVVMMVDWAINAIVQGQLVPDQDYRSHWADIISTTIDHIKTGKHVMA